MFALCWFSLNHITQRSSRRGLVNRTSGLWPVCVYLIINCSGGLHMLHATQLSWHLESSCWSLLPRWGWQRTPFGTERKKSIAGFATHACGRLLPLPILSVLECCRRHSVCLIICLLDGFLLTCSLSYLASFAASTRNLKVAADFRLLYNLHGTVSFMESLNLGFALPRINPFLLKACLHTSLRWKLGFWRPGIDISRSRTRRDKTSHEWYTLSSSHLGWH